MGRRKPIKNNLISLCEQLGSLGIWVRLHYVYPYPHVDDLIPLMAQGKILPYLDIPLQHASPKILKAMKQLAPLRKLSSGLKNGAKFAHLTLRSTFIVGFLSETRGFQLLLDFLKAQLESCRLL